MRLVSALAPLLESEYRPLRLLGLRSLASAKPHEASVVHSLVALSSDRNGDEDERRLAVEALGEIDPATTPTVGDGPTIGDRR